MGIPICKKRFSVHIQLLRMVEKLTMVIISELHVTDRHARPLVRRAISIRIRLPICEVSGTKTKKT